MSGGGGGGASLLHQASRTLTDIQVRALPTTAIEIVGAPGATRLLVPSVILARMNWVADFGNISPTCRLKVDLTSSFIADLNEASLSGVTALLAGGGPDGTWVPFTIQQLADSRTISATPAVDPHFHHGNADSGFYDADIANHALTISAVQGASNDFTDGTGSTLQVATVFYVFDYSSGLFLTTAESGWNESTRTFA